jgi:hypothetical protein
VLEGNQHAEVAGRRIDSSDESDEQNRHDRFDHREDKPRRGSQAGADEKQVSEIVAGRNEPDQQRQRGCSKQRGACDHSDLLRGKADRQEINRQDDDGKTIAESA